MKFLRWLVTCDRIVQCNTIHKGDIKDMHFTPNLAIPVNIGVSIGCEKPLKLEFDSTGTYMKLLPRELDCFTIK